MYGWQLPPVMLNLSDPPLLLVLMPNDWPFE